MSKYLIIELWNLGLYLYKGGRRFWIFLKMGELFQIVWTEEERVKIKMK